MAENRVFRFFLALAVGAVAGISFVRAQTPAPLDGISFAQTPAPLDGFPIANFAVTANVSADGEIFGRVLHNRGKLGSWLTDLGALRLTLKEVPDPDGIAADGAGMAGRSGMAVGGAGTAVDGDCTAGGRTAYPLSSYTQRDVRRAFPFVHATLSDHPVLRSNLSYTVWAPLGLDDLDVTTLPVLQFELTLTNPSDTPETLELCWTPDSLGHSPSHWRDFPALVGMSALQVQNGPDLPPAPVFLAAPGANDPQIAPPSSREAAGSNIVSIQAGGSVTLRYALVLYDPRDYAAIRFPSQDAVVAYVFGHWAELRQATEAFEARIPRTGDPALDDILRWYMVPGVALTKCTAKGQVVTLGYCELNQRDSYWASWLHLVLFPTAERTMIMESIGGMRPSGKVPTCILPRIDRKDDIDINAFFLLRCYRYARYTGDLELIRTNWDALRKAADWLMSRDLEDTGLPLQTSTWADWKDVAGVAGRKYSPFATMVYAAAMRRMAMMAGMLLDEPVVTAGLSVAQDGGERSASDAQAAAGDGRSVSDAQAAAGAGRSVSDDETLAADYAEAEAVYAAAAERALERINLPREQGGLWNGRYYCQLWDDGREDDRLLQDQAIGILFGVVPRGRARKVVRALNRTNATPFGICETFPYYEADFGYEPATYHNGAVWPWLSFVDDWARITLGRRREAIRLVKTVARADLSDSGDWAANEYINSLTGENLGFQLQGWNAGLFGLVYFGLAENGLVGAGLGGRCLADKHFPF